jgi:hypothetical protein
MILKLAIKILPLDKREAYTEEWSEVHGHWPSLRTHRALHALDLLRASISIRLQQSAFNSSVVAVGALIILSAIYLGSWLARDLVFAVLFLILRRITDFRKTLSIRASLMATLHFGLASVVVWIFGFVNWVLPDLKNDDVALFMLLKFFLCCVAACSLIAGVASMVLWLLDAMSADRSLGLRALAIFLNFALATYSLYEISYYVSTIGGVVVPADLVVQLSRIQQRTTNCILPAGLALAALWSIAFLNAKRRSLSSKESSHNRGALLDSASTYL